MFLWYNKDPLEDTKLYLKLWLSPSVVSLPSFVSKETLDESTNEENCQRMLEFRSVVRHAGPHSLELWKCGMEGGQWNMMRLRPYKPCDASTILSWIKDEAAFRKWSADRYPHYPITEADMNHKYLDCNGDCAEPDNFYPMTAFDESGIVGHLIMRFTDKKKTVLRFGFVIVDDSKRGMGCGKKMLRLALSFAFDILKVKKVTLGVLENNPGAYYCYKAAGFRDVPMDELEYYLLMGENVKCLELESER